MCQVGTWPVSGRDMTGVGWGSISSSVNLFRFALLRWEFIVFSTIPPLSSSCSRTFDLLSVWTLAKKLTEFQSYCFFKPIWVFLEDLSLSFHICSVSYRSAALRTPSDVTGASKSCQSLHGTDMWGSFPLESFLNLANRPQTASE